MTIDSDLFETMRLELRRGSLVLAVLACLRTERYGYTLRQALAADGLEMEESPLYPLLRRLEAQGLLNSEWREEEKRKKAAEDSAGEAGERSGVQELAAARVGHVVDLVHFCVIHDLLLPWAGVIDCNRFGSAPLRPSRWFSLRSGDL